MQLLLLLFGFVTDNLFRGPRITLRHWRLLLQALQKRCIWRFIYHDLIGLLLHFLRCWGDVRLEVISSVFDSTDKASLRPYNILDSLFFLLFVLAIWLVILLKIVIVFHNHFYFIVGIFNFTRNNIISFIFIFLILCLIKLKFILIITLVYILPLHTQHQLHFTCLLAQPLSLVALLRSLLLRICTLAFLLLLIHDFGLGVLF